MSRKLRIEYPGAMYHVMNRGNQREDIFRDDPDRQKFLSKLGEACARTEWQVHAYCLITAMSLKWIAQRLQMGTWTYVSNLLNEPPEPQPQAQEVLRCVNRTARLHRSRATAGTRPRAYC